MYSFFAGTNLDTQLSKIPVVEHLQACRFFMHSSSTTPKRGSLVNWWSFCKEYLSGSVASSYLLVTNAGICKSASFMLLLSTICFLSRKPQSSKFLMLAPPQTLLKIIFSNVGRLKWADEVGLALNEVRVGLKDPRAKHGRDVKAPEEGGFNSERGGGKLEQPVVKGGKEILHLGKEFSGVS